MTPVHLFVQRSECLPHILDGDYEYHRIITVFELGEPIRTRFSVSVHLKSDNAKALVEYNGEEKYSDFLAERIRKGVEKYVKKIGCDISQKELDNRIDIIREHLPKLLTACIEMQSFTIGYR